MESTVSNWLINYFSAVLDLIKDLWLYMLIGFVAAGLVEEFISEKRLLKYFGANNFLSLIRASAAGFVVSACTCGAIPLAASLRTRGASTATTLTFLLASPWLGIPMLLVYAKFLGWFNTSALVLISISTALTAGLIMAALERRGTIVQGKMYDEAQFENVVPLNSSISLWRRIFIRVPVHSWRLGKDIGFYLLIGVFLAAIPKVLFSPQAVTSYLGKESGLMGIFIAFPISVGIEACSEGFAVVAGQLYRQGASLAVVFVMTMVGVATDFTELSMLWKKFGKKTTLVYVLIGTVLTLIIGIILQFTLY